MASLLEAAGPLAILGAQAVYISEPILRNALPAVDFQALAGLFEDSEQVRAFVEYLREERTT